MKLNLDILGDALEFFTENPHAEHGYPGHRTPSTGDVYREKTLATAHQKILLGKPLGQGEHELISEGLESYRANLELMGGKTSPQAAAAQEVLTAFKGWPVLTEIEVPSAGPTPASAPSPVLDTEL
jgi:hypothetical protein